MAKKEDFVVKISPSVLSADFCRLGEEVEAAEKAGADLIHIDVMDGHFVPNITVGPLVVKAIKKISSVPLDVHLMVEEPDRYIEVFAEDGADIITVHSEACVHLHRTVHMIKDCKVKAGVSLNPASPLSSLDFILSDIDMALLMSVNPGFGGQKFIPDVLSKIKMLRNIIHDRDYKIDIEVDGGVNVDNAGEVVRAGADILVMGNAFFSSKDYSEVVKSVREKCR